MLISLAEYAKAHGRDPATARQMALRGGFQSARKIGRNWVIEGGEPWPDHRKKDLSRLQVGNWIVLTEDGIHESAFDGRLCFPTKKEAIADVNNSVMDSRKAPKVRRIRKGKYMYYPKNCDTGRFMDEYSIVLITPDNIDKYQRMWDDAEEAEE